MIKESLYIHLSEISQSSLTLSMKEGGSKSQSTSSLNKAPVAPPRADPDTKDANELRHSSASPQNVVTGITETVINSVWSGAASVGNFMWRFWNGGLGVKEENTAQNGEASLTVPETDEMPGHVRSVSNPEKLASAHSYYLEDADYGIRMLGRTVSGDDVILTQDALNKIHAALPPRFRLCTKWRLIYSTPEYGFALSTLFTQSRLNSGPNLLIIRDDCGAIFGVFATDGWRPHFGHYGTGECFLFRFEKDGRIRKWGSTGKNSFWMLSECEYLAAGCGQGRFGLWVDEELLNGQSYPVPTFDNECLASANHFKVINLELWGLDTEPLS